MVNMAKRLGQLPEKIINQVEVSIYTPIQFISFSHLLHPIQAKPHSNEQWITWFWIQTVLVSQSSHPWQETLRAARLSCTYLEFLIKKVNLGPLPYSKEILLSAQRLPVSSPSKYFRCRSVRRSECPWIFLSLVKQRAYLSNLSFFHKANNVIVTGRVYLVLENDSSYDCQIDGRMNTFAWMMLELDAYVKYAQNRLKITQTLFNDCTLSFNFLRPPKTSVNPDAARKQYTIQDTQLQITDKWESRESKSICAWWWAYFKPLSTYHQHIHEVYIIGGGYRSKTPRSSEYGFLFWGMVSAQDLSLP